MAAETEREVAWDPSRAHQLYVKAERKRRFSEGFKQCLARTAGTEIVQRTVTIKDDPENPLVLTYPEYADFVAEEAPMPPRKIIQPKPPEYRNLPA